MEFIVIPDTFKLVYQGGHHDVYCDAKEHLIPKGGGKCHSSINREKMVFIDSRFKCDCPKWEDHQ